MNSRTIKIAIDTTPLQERLTGVGYMIKMQTAWLERTFPQNQYLFYRAGSWYDSAVDGSCESPVLPAGKRFGRFPLPERVKHALKGAVFNWGLYRNRPDVFYQPNYISFPFFIDVPLVTTVHDLSHLRFPEFHPVERVKLFNNFFENSLRRSVCIVAVSEFTKNELVDLGLAREEKIEVVYHGVAESFRPLSEMEDGSKVLRTLQLEASGYLLFVGTVEPRKNLLRLLKAYEKYSNILQEAGEVPLRLVISGGFGWCLEELEPEIEKARNNPDILFLGYVDQDVLPVLYAGARALVYPSVYEGFGLPPLEAMACGVPVIASNNSAIPEVVGDAGILVDPFSVEEIKEALLTISRQDDLVKTLAQKSFFRARLFSWEKAVAKLHEILQRSAR